MVSGANGRTSGSPARAMGLALAGALLCAFLLPGHGVGAEGKLEGRGALRMRDPLEVNADQLEYRRKEHLTVYRGNVVAKQEEYRLRCQRLEVHLNPESGKIARLIAHGDVELQTQEGIATSGIALLDLASKAIILSESPRLVSGKESVEGQRIIYSISERKSTILGGREKRVKSLLIPGGKPR